MFKPSKVIFEKEAIEYEEAKTLLEKLKRENVEVEILNSNRVVGKKGQDPKEKYETEKKTLVVGVRKTLNFQNCKPSAHYQLPLVSGCMGMCEYCYLNTRLGQNNFIRVYVNTEEILQKAKEYIEERKPEKTIFEAAATSDPIPVEEYTHNLEKAITFMGKEELGRLRFVTKYPFVDSLLNLEHNGHTEIRFSLNTQKVIQDYEHKTASANKRIEALTKVKKVGYPTGVIIAPVFLYPNWKKEYKEVLENLKKSLVKEKLDTKLTFEVITHRYTTAAKNRILEFYPDTTLPMEEENRKFKYGQFGYGKYLYKDEDMKQVKSFFEENIQNLFPEGKILYLI